MLMMPPDWAVFCRLLIRVVTALMCRYSPKSQSDILISATKIRLATDLQRLPPRPLRPLFRRLHIYAYIRISNVTQSRFVTFDNANKRWFNRLFSLYSFDKVLSSNIHRKIADISTFLVRAWLHKILHIISIDSESVRGVARNLALPSG